MSLVQAVLEPDAFFQREFPGGRLSIAVVILLLFTVVFAGSLFVIGQVIAGAADLGSGEAGALTGILLASGVVSGVVFAIVAVVLAVLYYVGTAVVGGSGSFGDTFVVTAWGLVPSIVGTLLGTVLFAATFGGVEAGSPQAVARQAQAYQSNPLVLATNAVMTLWQIYIVGYGLKHARNVTAGQGLGVAAVISVLFLLTRLL